MTLPDLELRHPHHEGGSAVVGNALRLRHDATTEALRGSGSQAACATVACATASSRIASERISSPSSNTASEIVSG